jgi:uncharacterized protein Smg (DUF494 family)
MKQQIAELVSVIIQRIESEPETLHSERLLRSWLRGEGYSKQIIEAALRLLRAELRNRPARQPRFPRAARHLSPAEMNKLSPEARSAIARLELYELIDPLEREMLLERLGQIEGEVSAEDLDYLLNWLIGTTRDVETCQTIFSILEDRQLLN